MRANPGQHGATAVLVALVLTALVALLALALNVGHLLSVRGELQNGLDAAALAGARQLDGTAGKLAPARAAASAFAAQHLTDGTTAISVPSDTVELGQWSRSARTFTVIAGEDEAAALLINAVRVRSAQDKPVWIPTFVGRDATTGSATQVGTSAIAVTGGPCTSECGDLPFVLREGCVLDRCTTSGPSSGGFFRIAMTSDNNDTAGYTNLIPAASVSKTTICEILNDPTYCEDHRSDAALKEGDKVGTDNGDKLGGQCQETSESICMTIRSRVGQQAKIPVVRYKDQTGAWEPQTQCDGKYTDYAYIQGFATIRIALVQCKKNADADPTNDATDPGVPSIATGVPDSKSQWMLDTCYSTTSGTGSTSEQVCLWLELLCGLTDPHTNDPGCAWFGTSTIYPKLAR